jgi:colicin import membrane protein
MKDILKNGFVIVLSILLILAFENDVLGQGKSQEKKEHKEARWTSSEKMQEKRGEKSDSVKVQGKMREAKKESIHMSNHGGEKGKGHKEMHYGNGDMHGREFGHIRSEDAKQKMIKTHENMQKAEAAIKRSEEKIAQAKERLLKAEKEKSLSEEEIATKMEKIKKAEEKLTEAKEHLKTQHNEIHDKMMETKKPRKKKIKENEEVELEE